MPLSKFSELRLSCLFDFLLARKLLGLGPETAMDASALYTDRSSLPESMLGILILLIYEETNIVGEGTEASVTNAKPSSV